MAMQTDFLTYRLTIGLSTMEGRGFYYPSDTVIGHGHRLYVVNRSLEGVDRGIRVTMCDLDSEYYGTFGSYGEGDGQFVWPSSGAVDAQGHIYITDEYLHRVSTFDASGTFLAKWGAPGSDTGKLDGPSGIACDGHGNLYVSDTHNHRIQKFSASGAPLLCFGAKGGGEGQFHLPWGLTVAPHGDVYVADWGNDRIQRFSPDGAFVASYGEPGRGNGQLTRPASVAVDPQGYMYIADWGNERVQVLDPDGGFVQNLRGAATLSAWAVNFLNINKEEGAARARANLEPEIEFSDPDDPHEVSSHIEKYFWSPMSVKLDDGGQLYVTESNRHRIQIYGRSA
jgi:DNA-binding beta-propeller fold protein YncE